MEIIVTGHHIDITPALKAFTLEKFDKLNRHYDAVRSINVILSVEKLSQVAEATIKINKAELHASSESDNMYTAIDLLIDKLDKQLIKHKEKQENRN